MSDAFERSIELNAQNAEAHHIYAWALGVIADPDAMSHYQHALAVEPRRLITLSSIAQTYMREHRLDEVRRWSDSAIAVDPGYWFAYTWRARVRLLEGEIDEALADAEVAVRLSRGDNAYALTTLALAFAGAGDTTRARGLIDDALAILDDPVTTPLTAVVAMGLVGLDDERALQLLEGVRPRGKLFWSHLRVPEYDPIRSNQPITRLPM